MEKDFENSVAYRVVETGAQLMFYLLNFIKIEGREQFQVVFEILEILCPKFLSHPLWKAHMA